MKKYLSVVLAVLLAFSALAVTGSAEETPASGSFSAFCLNVAGLPDVSFITGGEGRDVPGNQTRIGQFVTAGQYDIFATQEDFGYHDTLVKALPDYRYQTAHRGGVPYGDGTNVYTRSFPLYNEAHITWNQLYGVADDGADQFSQKGITYVCVKVAENVFVDFYNIHADAYGDAGSVAARIDNFTQLRDLINARTVKNPVIVTGDFNAFLFRDSSKLKELLVDGLGLKDAWVETKNGGNYDDCAAFLEEYGASWTAKWGVWDSVERFMYMDGDSVSITCDSFDYVNVTNEDGTACSDHAAAEAQFSYTVTGETQQGSLTETDTGALSRLREFVRRVVGFFRALFFGLSNLDKVIAYFNK